MPKPKKEFTEKEINQIRDMAGYGLTQENICIVIGFSRPLFRNKEVKAAFNTGKSIASSKVHQTFFEMATSGKDWNATKLWLSRYEKITDPKISAETEKIKLDIKMGTSILEDIEEIKKGLAKAREK